MNDEVTTVRQTLLTLGLVAMTLAAASTVHAHHSAAGFDGTKVKEITGTIKEFQFKNPHSWIQVIVENEKGEKTEWSVEWGSPNNLGRQGIRPSTFPPGANVTIRLNPMDNGGPAGGFVGAKFLDGKTVGRWEP